MAKQAVQTPAPAAAPTAQAPAQTTTPTAQTQAPAAAPAPKPGEKQTPPPAPTQSPVLPEHVAAIAAREAEFVKREIELKQRLAEAEKYRAVADEHAKLTARLKADPYGVLEEAGGNLETYAKRVMQGDPKKPTVEELVPQLMQEIKDLRALAEKQGQEMQQSATRSEAAVYASEMLQHMGDGEQYRPIKQYMDVLRIIGGGQEPDLVGAVQQMIVTARQTTGKLLTPAEACATLLQEAQGYMSKLSTALGTQAQAQAPAPTAAPPQQTMTGSQETGAAPAVDLASMTPEQRIEYVTRRLQAGAYAAK